MTLKRQLKLAALRGAQLTGLFPATQNSAWRRQRLLILCYHGLSMDREHEWLPAFFMPPQTFQERMRVLKDSGIRVLPLSQAVEALRNGALTEPSAVITFDDGFRDFYLHAAPVLAQYGFPCTLYLTTWYVDRPYPVFGVFCSYLLWKSIGRTLKLGAEFGLPEAIVLHSSADAQQAAAAILAFVEQRGLSGDDKDRFAMRLCEALGFDYAALIGSQLLQQMTREQVKTLAAAGIDMQLHTHRHRTPLDETLFRREIVDNRDQIQSMTGKQPEHFCYPSGVYRQEFLPWLRSEGVLSATTCEPGLATRDTEACLLPRFLDAANVTGLEFESLISGFAQRYLGR